MIILCACLPSYRLLLVFQSEAKVLSFRPTSSLMPLRKLLFVTRRARIGAAGSAGGGPQDFFAAATTWKSSRIQSLTFTRSRDGSRMS